MYFEKTVGQEKYAVCYDKAIRDDGTLLFPEKLTATFLAAQRKAQGSYIFAHQYQNEIIPAEDQDFKKEWLAHYDKLPSRKNTIVMIDPAISLDQEACYTALVVIDVDEENQRYLRMAKRMRITATQTVKLIFDVYELMKPSLIGVEAVGYQMALIHFIQAEMRKRRVNVPLYPVKRAPDKSKPMRIRSLVPWFEYQKILIKPGLKDFEDEYLKFPRGTFVDILDALADAMELAQPPAKERKHHAPLAPNHPDYERQYIQRLLERKEREGRDGDAA